MCGVAGRIGLGRPGRGKRAVVRRDGQGFFPRIHNDFLHNAHHDAGGDDGCPTRADEREVLPRDRDHTHVHAGVDDGLAHDHAQKPAQDEQAEEVLDPECLYRHPDGEHGKQQQDERPSTTLYSSTRIENIKSLSAWDRKYF